MADVFISYHVASATDVVRQITGQLRKRGITYWYSGGDMVPGFNFARTVPPQIDTCKVFLLILDEGATKSPHVENELGLAFERIHELVIIPFRIQKCPLSASMRYYLKHIQIMNSHLIPPLDKRVEELADYMTQIITVLKSREAAQRQEADRKAREEAQRREAERRAREAAQRREAERRAQEAAQRQEADRKAREEAQRREAERRAREAAQRQEAERGFLAELIEEIYNLGMGGMVGLIVGGIIGLLTVVIAGCVCVCGLKIVYGTDNGILIGIIGGGVVIPVSLSIILFGFLFLLSIAEELPYTASLAPLVVGFLGVVIYGIKIIFELRIPM